MNIINESLGKEYTFEELIKEYKSEYLKYKLYSSATVLYCSNVFSNVFDVISTPIEEKTEISVEKVGRNEPCPCGSGKKYKLCCGRN
jgi:preprotein translocase subunit SecA